MKDAAASLRNCGRIIWTKYQSKVLCFENSFFRIEQLMMLFFVQNVLYWFQVSHFYIMM